MADDAVAGPGGHGGRGHGGHGGRGGSPDRGGPPQEGQIRIDAPKWTLRARLGPGFVTPAYDSGWEVISRPDDVGLTQFGGRDPDRESVPILVDGWRGGESVETEIGKVESLLRRDKPKDKHPPVFRVRGGGLRLAGQEVVLETLDMGEYLLRKDDVRIRQHMTLGLLLYKRGDRIEIRGPHKGGGRDTYTTKQGDTLRSIAAKVLSDNASDDRVSDLANKIGDLNGIKDIRKRLDAGIKLKLP